MSHVGRICRGERYMQNHLTNIQNRANCLLRRRLAKLQLTPSYPSIYFRFLLLSTLGLPGAAGACTHFVQISPGSDRIDPAWCPKQRGHFSKPLFDCLFYLCCLHWNVPLTGIHGSHWALASTGTHTTQIQAWIFTRQHSGVDKW